MELDNKLRDIFRSSASNRWHELLHGDWIAESVTEELDRVVAEIKQAFTDEQNKEIDKYNLMTGQEWYDRFEKEYSKIKHPDLKAGRGSAIGVALSVKEAAKKASGI